MFLVVIKGSNPGAIIILTKTGGMVAGRSKECEIQILDSLVSRKHFQVEARENSFYIKDLGSTNKTFVNKKPLSGEQKMELGDVVELGDTALLFTDQKEIPIKSVEDFNKIRINQTMRIDLPPK
jgi:pSer/pThr/pTyr-binding forkhead associated (FHA) protein